MSNRAFTSDDAWLLSAGTHTRLWEVLGAHVHPEVQQATVRVWAPNAQRVALIGDLTDWRDDGLELDPDPSGVWRGTFDGWSLGSRYKFRITSAHGGYTVDKADPVAFATEEPPATASVMAAPLHAWGDAEWMATRAERQAHDRPMSVYEVHLGSWRYEPGGYEALGEQLAQYCTDLGFTHVELLPVTEHPFYGSWGYQTTGYFAASARYGRPEALMACIDKLHQAGIGVILDWVPSHFPTDEHGLGYFDGTHLYEHADPRQGFHPDWKSFVFNYGRNEVRSFLLSSAHYWLERFHIDGLRVDAVASMLYLDYSRDDGEWLANEHGGNENLEAIEFLQELNRTVGDERPDVVMIAEESTAWPGVTGPIENGGLGFHFKWDMGWMHDTLHYLARDPAHRRWHHDELTFRSVYAASEHYMLPLSHDEVVHGKGSLLSRMPGDRWQQFANLRLLYGYQWTAPGKPLLFMGGEFATWPEWHHERELQWSDLGDPLHAGMRGWVRALNELLVEHPPLWQVDRDPAGFGWIVNDDHEQSVVAFGRYAADGSPIVVVMNLTPVVRHDYRIGVPMAGRWQVAANSDDAGWGGSGVAALDGDAIAADSIEGHGHDQSLALTLPPLAVVVLAPAAAQT